MRQWLIAAAAVLAAQAAEAQQRPAVVELFTSQGCSSCPPADALLGELVQRRDIIGLAYHVDYWDGIGWKDRYALPDSTARQAGYKRRLALRSLYTPQMVIDGRVDVVGSDRAQVLRLLGSRRAVVTPRVAKDGGTVVVELPQAAAHQPTDIVAVAYLRQAETAIARGENAGRRLREFNLVRGWRVLGQWSGEALVLVMPINELPSDADAVAVLVQEADQGAILGAAAMDLPR